MPLMECGEGGYKWGESGVCFTGPDAKEKALAVGRAVQANDSGIFFDAVLALAGKVDADTGFLTTNVKLARVGVQQYLGFELGLIDRAFEKIGVFRPPEEVFSDESVKSFANLVVTDDHPEDAVTVDNVKSLQVGQVSHVSQEDKVLGGLVTITDKDQVQKALDGKVEVSVGYTNDLVARKGSFEGMDYEFVQTNIRANHLAIVDAGRCGSACKLTIDRKEVSMIKITIDGIDFDVPENVAQAYTKFAADMKKKVKDAEEATKKAEEEKDEMKEKKEKAEGTADALKSKVLDSDAMAKLVNDKAELIATAKGILGDKFPELTADCGTCDTKLKAAVIGHVMDGVDLSGKPDA
ncbi:MAG: DUF2213 domain-containing protein, partial [Desulfobacteraceae bacterium]|nr:DUF2213 domain-containing protein [Desulfobacteraceae bacterium]